MSAGDFEAVRTLPVQVASALARYERHVRKLAATWLDMELYCTVSEEIDGIQGYCSGIPAFSVSATSLLISHADLVHALWRHGQCPGDPGELEAKLRDHLACIDALARRCLRMVGRDDESAPLD